MHKFNESELNEILADGTKVEVYEFVESHRWYDLFELVFFDEESEEFFRAYHMSPSTELQEGQDEWDSDYDGMVELEIVEPYQETVTKYRRKTV